MEEIAIVNEKDEIIGSQQFSKVHKLGLLHRESYIYLINPKNEVLLQKRKDTGLWDHSAAGHFSKKESYEQGAIREFLEELGIKIHENELITVGYEQLSTVKPDKNNFRFAKIFVVKKDISLQDIKKDDNEVAEVQFFNKAELKQLLQQPGFLMESAKLVINKYIIDRI